MADRLLRAANAADDNGTAPGRRWLRISSLRLGGNAAPIGWTDVYVDAAYAELRDVVRETPDVLISSLIETRYGRRIAEIRQDIQAVLLTHRLAGELAAVPGTPALKIVRHYLDPAGEIFEISITIHPADRFTFFIRLKRERN